jgi:hypothetical protein
MERNQALAADLVILAGQWHVYNSPPFLPSLIDVVEPLGARGIKVAVIGPPAQYTEKLPLLLARHAALYPRTFDGTKYLSEYPFETDRKMEQMIAAIPGTRFMSQLKLFCPARRCPVLAPDGVPVQWDTHHLTLEGSILVAEKLLKPLRDFVESPSSPVASSVPK